MDGILSIFQSVSSAEHTYLPKLLNSLDDHQIFQHKLTNELDPIVSHITNLLNNSPTKHVGMLLLNEFLMQCPLDLLDQKGALWIALCTKVCTQKKPIQSTMVAYSVLGELLKKSVHIPDLGKSISNNLLQKIIETIPTSSPIATLSAMKCLEICMQTYPGSCSSSRNTIEKYILNFVDSADITLVTQSGKCLQLLQQIRGGGTQGISHKVAWGQLQTQIIGSLHKLLDAIYSNTIETVDGSTETGELKLPEIELSDEPVTRTSQLVTRFSNLCKYLTIILLEPFPVSKAIQPVKILGLISRGLAVNCLTLSKNLIVDNIAVGMLIPQIHVVLFKLLDSLILLLRGNILPYGKNICHLVNQSLKWTSSGKAAGCKRPHGSIRKAAYNTLGLWCKTSKYGSCVESLADDLIQQILQDITPFQNEVTLKVLSGAKKFLSKKARQKLHKAQNEATNLSQTHSKAFNPHNTKINFSDEGNQSLCASALTCLIHVLDSSGCFLKPVIHKILQENIVFLAVNVLQLKSLKLQLYGSAECRKKLYGILHALIISPQHLCPPPVQYAATIFSLAHVRDVSPNVRDICDIYLRSIEKLLHPQKDNLYFPPEINEIRNAMNDIQKEVPLTSDITMDEVEIYLSNPKMTALYRQEDLQNKRSDSIQVEDLNNYETVNGKHNMKKINEKAENGSAKDVPHKNEQDDNTEENIQNPIDDDEHEQNNNTNENIQNPTVDGCYNKIQEMTVEQPHTGDVDSNANGNNSKEIITINEDANSNELSNSLHLDSDEEIVDMTYEDDDANLSKTKMSEIIIISDEVKSRKTRLSETINISDEDDEDDDGPITQNKKRKRNYTEDDILSTFVDELNDDII